MRRTIDDRKAIQEKVKEKLELHGKGAVQYYGDKLKLDKCFCPTCNEVTHTLLCSSGDYCLICEKVKPDKEGSVRNAKLSDARERQGRMIVEVVGDILFEITAGAHEVKDTDGIEQGFNLVAVFSVHDQSTCTVYGSINDAWTSTFVSTGKDIMRIETVGEHDLINLQRMAEEAFTFEELKINWLHGKLHPKTDK